jgi:ATP-binding cassette, subfamily B, bacterial PglK
MILLSVFFDTIGIGMVIPIINVLIDNDFTNKFQFIQNIIDHLGNPKKEELLISMVVFLLSIFLIKNIFLGILTWKKENFTYSVANLYAKKLLNNYCNKPYLFHKNNNSSKLINNLVHETSVASAQFVLAFIDLIIEIILLSALFFLLLFVEPLVTIVMLLIFASVGSLYFLLVKKKMLNYGYIRQKTNVQKLKLYKEFFLNIRFLLIYKKTKRIFNAIFDNLNKIKNLNTRYTFLQSFPRLLFEYLIIIIFGFFVIGYIYSDHLLMQNLIPTLALFSAAAFRMLPSINKIIIKLQNLKYAKSAMELISNEINSSNGVKDNKKNEEQFIFKNLNFKNVFFKYDNRQDYVIEDATFNIEKGKIYGFIGRTGSGKTTLTDLIMGLLDVKSGEIKLNNKFDLSEVKFDWHKKIGFVPQNIFLEDDTIKNNIAYGEFDEEINKNNLSKSIKSAQLEDFISNLGNGLSTQVGENGSKLSGGQIQRIGIARALYFNPEILILDEITSSLDSNTEEQILNVIKNLKNEITIILITHKTSAMVICDEIFEVNNKKILKKK